MIIVLLAAFSGRALIKGIHGLSEQKVFNKRHKATIMLYNASCEDYDLEGLCSARNEFISIGGFKDSDDYVNNVEYEIGRLNMYNDAFDSFEVILEYRDSEELASALANELYSDAELNIENEEYNTAKNKLNMIPVYLLDEYEKAQSLYSQVDVIKSERENTRKYESAICKYNEKDIVETQKLFIELGDYKNTRSYLDSIGQDIYNETKALYNSKDYVQCYEKLELIDTQKEWGGYSQAITLKDDEKEEYVADVETNALQILDEVGYRAFKEYVNGATNGIFTKNDVAALLNAHKLEFLSDMDFFDSFEWQSADSLMASGWQNYDLYFEDGVMDTYGNYHSHSLLGGGCANGYYLGGKYTRITGTLFIIDGHRATEDRPDFIAIKNGDGEMLYAGKLMSGYDNLEFSVDVTGEEKIYIYFDGFYGNFIDSDFYGGAGEVALLK